MGIKNMYRFLYLPLLLAPSLAHSQDWTQTSVPSGSPNGSFSRNLTGGTTCITFQGRQTCGPESVVTPQNTPSGSEYIVAGCGLPGGNGSVIALPCANGDAGRQTVISLNAFARADSVTALQQQLAALGAGFGQDLGALRSSFQEQLSGLREFTSSVRRETRAGIASAVAMSTASMPSAPGRTSWTVNVAEYQSMAAVGGSLAHRFSTNAPFAVTAGFAISDGARSHVARLGLSGEF